MICHTQILWADSYGKSQKIKEQIMSFQSL